MSENAESPKGADFIEIGGYVTHFTSGQGTRDYPYGSLGGTPIDKALLDGFWLARVSPRKEKTSFFEYNGRLVSVNSDMQAKVEGPADPDFQKMLDDEAKILRDQGNRDMTPEEQQETYQEFKKRVSKRHSFVGKIFEKFGF